MIQPARFVIGYEDGAHAVWGRGNEQGVGYLNTMPLKEAARRAGHLPSVKAVRVVYKLVPVLTFKPSAKE